MEIRLVSSVGKLTRSKKERREAADFFCNVKKEYIN